MKSVNKPDGSLTKNELMIGKKKFKLVTVEEFWNELSKKIDEDIEKVMKERNRERK